MLAKVRAEANSFFESFKLFYHCEWVFRIGLPLWKNDFIKLYRPCDLVVLIGN